jgi:hypothetical protein
LFKPCKDLITLYRGKLKTKIRSSITIKSNAKGQSEKKIQFKKGQKDLTLVSMTNSRPDYKVKEKTYGGQLL